MAPDCRAVGLFDSGVGGLTVVKACLARLDRSLVYFADQAHVPYGDRDPHEVRGFALAISRFLVDEGCSAVVMACNISSAMALETARAEHPRLPVIGVIESAVTLALDAHRSLGGPIGVLATAGTVQSGAYSAAIRTRRPEAEVLEVACPELVPLVEAGHLNDALALDACRRYLAPLADAQCRVVILGCTHYPLLLNALEEASIGLFAQRPCFIDPAGAVARELELTMRAGPCPTSMLRLITSGDGPRFRKQAAGILGEDPGGVEQAVWLEGRPVLLRGCPPQGQHRQLRSAAEPERPAGGSEPAGDV